MMPDAFDKINEFLNASRYKDIALFFNLGYQEIAGDQSAAKLDDALFNKNSIRLVLEVIGPVDLNGKRIMDVGCGRGGAISVIRRYFRPRQLWGVDLSEPSIEFCKKRFPFEDVQFTQANAKDLPFDEETFDMVCMIELMQSGPEIFECYRQAGKVLSEDGYFLHAGIFPAEHRDDTMRLLEHLFLIEDDRDVTENVMSSIGSDELVRRKIYDGFPSADMLNDFLIVSDNTVFDQLKSRTATYRLMRMRKRVK